MLRYFSFFFNDTATTEIYTLSLHDALPISHTHTDTHIHTSVWGSSNTYTHHTHYTHTIHTHTHTTHTIHTHTSHPYMHASLTPHTHNTHPPHTHTRTPPLPHPHTHTHTHTHTHKRSLTHTHTDRQSPFACELVAGSSEGNSVKRPPPRGNATRCGSRHR